MRRSCELLTLTAALAASAAAHANPVPLGGPSATSVFGSRPAFAPGVSVGVVVDTFGLIHTGLTEQRQAEIAKTIAEWYDAGVEYGAYYDFSGSEYAALGPSHPDLETAQGARVDLDGSLLTRLDESSGDTLYLASPTRAHYRQWLIDSGKLAIELGATHIFLDIASIDYSVMSFDDEVVAAFAEHIGEPSFDLADHLLGLGFDDIEELEAARAIDDATLLGDSYWQAWVAFDPILEETHFEEWASALREHAESLDSHVRVSGNRYFDGTDQWLMGDVFDYLIAETFLDALGYPHRDLNFQYKTAVAFGRRFWSWNFPNNTGSLNGTGDPWAQAPCNELDRLFVAQTFANGGLSQVCGVGWVHYHYYGYVPDEVAPLYELVERHPQQFDHPEASEFAVLYSEPWVRFDVGQADAAFRGATYLLSDAQRTWDVVFAADPLARDGSERLSLERLSPYRGVVLPRTEILTEGHIALLEQYLAAGGTVIGFGPVARLNESGQDVSGGRSFDDLFGSDQVDTGSYAGTVVAFNQDLGTSLHSASSNATARAAVVADFRSVVDPVVVPEIVTTLSSSAHLTRFEDESDGSHIYHVVNTDYDEGSGQVVPVDAGATLEVPLPQAYSGAAVVSFVEPEAAEPQLLAALGEGGTLTITLPVLNEWGVLRVGSAISSPPSVDRRPWSALHTVDNQLTSLDDELHTGGHRPDELDADGAIAFNYWYWKGGNHGSIPFPVPFFASDDIALDRVELFYRFSADGLDFGSWTLHDDVDFSAGSALDFFEFGAPDGEGYYEVYVRAHDAGGNAEPTVPGPEGGYGVDWTAPEAPEAGEASSVQAGTWQQAVELPVFTWGELPDNLSGPLGGNVQLVSLENGFTLASCSIADLSATQQWDVSDCDGGETVNSLAPGRYAFQMRAEDQAGNWSSTYRLFDFYYGVLPVDDVEKVEVVPGDESLDVSWDAPDDPRYAYAGVYFRRADVAGEPWSNVALSADANDTQKILFVANDVPYEVMVSAYSDTHQPGNQVMAPCLYTPGLTPVSDCGDEGGGGVGGSGAGGASGGSGPGGGGPGGGGPGGGGAGGTSGGAGPGGSGAGGASGGAGGKASHGGAAGSSTTQDENGSGAGGSASGATGDGDDDESSTGGGATDSNDMDGDPEGTDDRIVGDDGSMSSNEASNADGGEVGGESEPDDSETQSDVDVPASEDTETLSDPEKKASRESGAERASPSSDTQSDKSVSNSSSGCSVSEARGPGGRWFAFVLPLLVFGLRRRREPSRALRK